MGFRFRKSINLGGGAKINLSKKGIGASVGTKGYRVTKKAGGGTRTTASIAGTGISYQKDSSKAKSKSNGGVSAAAAEKKANYRFFWILYTILCIPMFALGALLLLVEPMWGVASIAIGIAEVLAARHYKKKHKEQKQC